MSRGEVSFPVSCPLGVKIGKLPTSCCRDESCCFREAHRKQSSPENTKQLKGIRLRSGRSPVLTQD